MAVTWTLVFAVITIVMQAAQAQTFTVLHNFTEGADGASPYAGLTMDKAGNLYGTASAGGMLLDYCSAGCGTVFKLARTNSGWTFSPLYSFGISSGSGGFDPIAGVAIGPDGNLYGTTHFAASGGGQYCSLPGCGTVFKLQPPATVCKSVLCQWSEVELYAFGGANDGANPGYGSVTFDQAGNIYGTTQTGGGVRCTACGTVYELSRSQGWRESILYSFINGGGFAPMSGVVFDNVGNLYGTTEEGGTGNCVLGCGVVYTLSSSTNGWQESVLYNFGGGSDGANPSAGLIFDQAGNMYGATRGGGYQGGSCSRRAAAWSLS